MNKKTLNILFVLLISTTLFSQQWQNQNIPSIQASDVNGWAKSFTLKLDTTISEHLLVYNALNNYSYSNLEIEISTIPNVRLIKQFSHSELKILKGRIIFHYSNQENIYSLISVLNQIFLWNSENIPLGTFRISSMFKYRGMHLDVARHFFPVEDVKKYIDYLFFYGYNKFHWHLTEDQGWRIEIKKYPKLQEIAAFRDETLIGHYNDQPHQFDGKKYGGYYTHDEIRDIVKYASLKGIDIIPEIELPGHSLAAISAYPNLSCDTTKSYKVATKWGIFDDIYCPSETTFNFLRDVFSEVVDLFPYEYIHIGGDEAPKTVWKNSKLCQQIIKEQGLKNYSELQSYFIQKIETYLKTKGKKIIGWDEILEGGISEETTIMSWRGSEGGIEAAEAQRDVIMTPNGTCYFDHYQSDHPEEPLAIGGLTTVEDLYQWEVIPDQISKDKRPYIIGAQGNVWTEYISTFSHVEYMALTRMITLSEVLHRDQSTRNYDAFVPLLESHIRFWKSNNVNIANHLYDVSPVYKIIDRSTTITDLSNSLSSGFEFQHEDSEWQNLLLPFSLDKEGKYNFRAKSNSTDQHRKRSIYFTPNLATQADISVIPLPSEHYSGQGEHSLINGIFGSDTKYGGKEWLGFYNKDVEIQLDYDAPIDISNIQLRFFNGQGQWIYLPKNIKIFRNDQNQPSLIYESSQLKIHDNIGQLIFKQTIKNCQGLIIKVENFGKIPEGRQGGGHPSWLFIDEIMIN